jgi:ribosome-binding ATPase YchF (GTP1/OBG family)
MSTSCAAYVDANTIEDSDRIAYLTELGLSESGLEKIITQAYKTLGLITFITAGPKESKAWTCKAGTKAPQAAGIIHTDFEKGFIRAEVIQWDKLLEVHCVSLLHYRSK